MKTKLGHLIMASLISLSFVLSTTGISYAGRFVTKKSTYLTTSASGFNEGPITQKNDNGGVHVEVYDPQKNVVQPPLDLRLDMLRVNYEKVRVTVRNISSHNTNGLLWIHFLLVNPDDPNEGMSWSQTFDVPDPYQNMTTYIAFEPPQTNNGKGWRLHAWANYVWGEWQLVESNYSNNRKVICRYDEDCQ